VTFENFKNRHMKNIIYLILIMLFFSSCIKYPEADFVENPECIGCSAPYYTAYYILNSITTKITDNDSVSYDTINYDTLRYNDLSIITDFYGQIIADQTYEYLSSSDGRYRKVPTQPYFVNKIQKIEILTNKPYNTNENNFAIYFRDKEKKYSQKNYIGEELGYTPLKTELTAPPDNPQSFVFTIKITDDKNNVFTSSTDSIFVLN